MFACRHGHDDIVDLLLRAGASANQRAYDGATALYIAAQNGHAAAATRLLRATRCDALLYEDAERLAERHLAPWGCVRRDASRRS